MKIFLIIFLIILFIGILFMIRNTIVYNVRVKAIDLCYDKGNSRKAWKLFDETSYEDMVFKSLTKWTFEGFYPDLEKRIERINREDNLND